MEHKFIPFSPDTDGKSYKRAPQFMFSQKGRTGLMCYNAEREGGMICS